MSHQKLTIKELQEILSDLDQDLEVVFRFEKNDLAEVDISEVFDPDLKKTVLLFEAF